VITVTNETFVITPNTADLSIGVTGTPESAARSGELSYTVTVVNRGPATASGVIMVNELPGAVSVASVGPQSIDCNVASGSVICDLGTLAPDEGAVVSINVVVSGDAEGVLVNQASVSGTETDPVGANDFATLETQVIVGVLSYVVSIKEGNIETTGITMTDSPDPVFLGNDLTYDLDVSNSGTETVTDVNMIVTLPASTNFVSAVVEFLVGGASAGLRTSDLPGGAPKVASLLGNTASPAVARVGECTEENGTVICALGALEPGQTARVTIVVEPRAPGILNNQTTLVKEGAAADAPTQTANERTTVILVTDLSISLQDVSSSVIAGDQITFDFTVDNAGPSTASGVLVSEILPEGLFLVPSAADPSTCTVSDGEIKCLIGSLSRGESRLLSITLGMDPSATGELVNTITVSGSGEDFDSSGNSVSATISITELAVLSLGRTDSLGSESEDPKHNDNEIVTAFTVQNDGPSNATNIVLTNELSVEMALVSVSGDPADCNVTAGTLVCVLNDLEKGQSTSFTVVLASDTDGNVSSTAGVRSDQSIPLVLEPVEFFLDLAEGEEEPAPSRIDPRDNIAPSSAQLGPTSGGGTDLKIGAILMGLGMLGLSGLLGNSFVVGIRNRLT